MQLTKNPIPGALDGKTVYGIWASPLEPSEEDDATDEDSREDYSEYAMMRRLGMSIRDFM